MVLGMRDEVVIADYDPEWPREFDEEKGRILGAIGESLEVVEHIGSTSVPGLAAKPIIDILLVVRPFPLTLAQVDAVCGLGYFYKAEHGISGRQYFTKQFWLGTHHLHAFSRGNPEIVRHLAFRDYLRVHPAVAREYESLKRELAERFRGRRESYTDAKTGFIRAVEEKAFVWAGMEHPADR